MTKAQREPYRRAYEADKDEFDRALEVYKASGRLEAWKRDPHKPRRPLNAFAQFCKDLYAEDATHTFHDVLKRAPARWRALDEEQRGRYQREANLRNIKYMLQMEDYKLSGKEAVWNEMRDMDLMLAGVKRVEPKSRRRRPKSDGGKPRNPDDEDFDWDAADIDWDTPWQ